MSNNRIYLVRAKTTHCTLVRAANQAQAVRHVARAEFTATVATQEELVSLLPDHPVEDASSAPEVEAE